MAPKTTIRIQLTGEERAELEGRSRAYTRAHGDVVRAQIILLLAAGRSVSAIARELGRQRRIVRKWGERFVRKRLKGLEDAPRSGRPPVFSPRSGRAPREAGVRAS